MNFYYRIRQHLMAIVLTCVLVLTTACNSTTARSPQANSPTKLDRTIGYTQLSHGNSDTGAEFGSWAVEASKGLIKDAFVRDNNKLGAVISPQVRPTEVKQLAGSLAQGFHKSFPDRDLSILMYAPDKKLILTARYDAQSQQIEYQAAS
jgi:hypothetical protein